jgi:hypothetical protein
MREHRPRCLGQRVDGTIASVSLRTINEIEHPTGQQRVERGTSEPGMIAEAALAFNKLEFDHK